MEKKKEIEIPKELMEEAWTSNKVVLKRLTFGEQMRIRDEATNIKFKGKEIGGSVNQEIAFISTIVKSVVEAPWKVNDTVTVRDLDGSLGQWVLKELEEFNSVSEEKKKD